MTYHRVPRSNQPMDDYRLRPREDRTYHSRPNGNVYNTNRASFDGNVYNTNRASFDGNVHNTNRASYDGNVYNTNRASYYPNNRRSEAYTTYNEQFAPRRKLPMPPPPSPPVPTTWATPQFPYPNHPPPDYEAEMQARFSNVHMHRGEEQHYYDDCGGYECPRDLNNDSYGTIEMERPEAEFERVYHYDRNRFMYEDPKFEIDLLLIGKTGHGKSALGNSILGRNVFDSRPSSTSVTKSVTDEVVEYKGKVIKVVDGPGVVDTDLNDEDAKKLIMESLSYAVTLNLRGYHAFLLVVKYADRFTKESRLTIEVLKKVFGENFVKKFCILVMTYGDQYESNASFRDWLDKEKGDLVDLVKECDNRVILYDNKTKDKGKKDGQLDALLDMVQMLALKNGRYTNEQFELEKLSRDALLLEPKKVIIEEESMKEASLILEKLRSLQADTENIDNDVNIEGLDRLTYRTNALLDKLKEQDKNTGVLQDLISHVQSLLNSVNDESRLMERITKMLANASVDGQLELLDHIRRQREEFYLSHAEGKIQEIPEGQTIGKLPEFCDEIYDMKKQWKKTNQLNSQLKEIKKNKKKSIFKTFQNKVLAALKVNMKDGRKSYDITDQQT